MSNSKIPWKKHDLEYHYQDVLIKAKITYWAKDYSIEVLEPFEKVIIGPHMMYMIPVKYAINETPASGIHIVDLIPLCKKNISKAYHEYNDNS